MGAQLKKVMRLVAHAKRKYPDTWGSLTKEQKTLVIQSIEDQHPELYANRQTGEQHPESHISVINKSDKQEPDAVKLSYGDNGKPELPTKASAYAKDSREDRVCDCLGVTISAAQRKQLKALLRSFDDESKKTYDNQSLIRYSYMLLDSKNPKLEIATYLRAAGIDVNVSGEKLAKPYGVTRQAISKKTQNKKRKLGLPDETRDSKKTESREIYKGSNNRNYKID